MPASIVYAFPCPRATFSFLHAKKRTSFFNLACHWPKACQFLKLQINVPKSVPLFQLLRPKDMQNFQLFFKSKYFSIIYLIFANLVSCNYLGFPTQADYNSRKSQYSQAFFILFSRFRCGKFEKPSLLAR